MNMQNPEKALIARRYSPERQLTWFATCRSPFLQR